MSPLEPSARSPFGGRDRAAPEEWDVVVIGAGFSGASAAFLLRRAHPNLRILLVERKEEFDRKVGEATVELSALFLVKALGLSTYLNRHHLPKHGLRYWYVRSAADDIARASELGAWDCAHVPTFLLARDRLDEHILGMAERQGAVLLRPARVRDVELGRYENTVEILEKGGRRRRVRAPWIIDASGRSTQLARRFGWLDSATPHTVGAIWGRWKGVLDLDGLDEEAPGRIDFSTIAPRTMATNHLCARGSWVWFIPLSSEETSVGVVYHHDFHRLHKEPDRRKAYLQFLNENPLSRRWLRDAELVEKDVKTYPLLPYVTRHYAGEGHALVGDAAAFIDPFYSPGLDHCAQSTMSTVRLVSRYFDEGPSAALRAAIDEHDASFRRSYQRLRDAVFVPKYRYFGEWDLFRAAYLLEVTGYFLTLARPSWKDFERSYCVPPLAGRWWGPALYAVARFYNRRLAAIADRRVRMGKAGLRNLDRHGATSFRLELPAILRNALQGLWLYLRAEIEHALTFVVASRKEPLASDEARRETPRQGAA